MLTFTQLKVSKAKRKPLNQKQRAQILDIEVARKFVWQAIEEALTVRRTSGGLYGEDLDRLYRNQPVHFDGMGHIPHWFKREDISEWGEQICRKFTPAIMKRRMNSTPPQKPNTPGGPGA